MWTLSSLVKFYILFFMELSTRKVYLAGIKHSPDGPYMKQVARNLTDCYDGFLLGKRFLIIDRDKKYCKTFFDIIQDACTKPVRCPVKAPNCNAFAERFVKSIKYECLNKMIFFGVGSLQRAIRNYLDHYHRERNHQGRSIQVSFYHHLYDCMYKLSAEFHPGKRCYLKQHGRCTFIRIFGPHDRRLLGQDTSQKDPKHSRSK